LLRPGGLFVLEVWNRAAYRGLSEAVRSPDRIVRAGAREIRRRREVYLDEAVAGALVIRHNYELHPGRQGQTSEFLEEHHRLRPRDAEELRNFAASAQLRLVERYADLSGKASQDSNVGLVLVFKKETTHIGR
jgi:hypothetical protein